MTTIDDQNNLNYDIEGEKKMKQGFKAIREENLPVMRYEKGGIVVRFFSDWTPFIPVNTMYTAQVFKSGGEILFQETVAWENRDELEERAFQFATDLLESKNQEYREFIDSLQF